MLRGHESIVSRKFCEMRRQFEGFTTPSRTRRTKDGSALNSPVIFRVASTVGWQGREPTVVMGGTAYGLVSLVKVRVVFFDFDCL
jgi:hypothetical protein